MLKQRRLPLGTGLSLLFLAAMVSPVAAQDASPKSLVGHAGPVNMAIFTPDAKYIVTASNDQTIKLWNPATGAEMRTLAGHTEQVIAVAVDPASSLIASAGGDNSLRIWDIPKLQPLAALEGHPSAAARSVSASLDGKLFASAGSDKLARLYSAADGKTIATLAGHTAELTASAFRNDNTQLVTADATGEIRLWSAVDGAPQGVVGAHAGAIGGIEFHPNNQQLVSVGDDGALKIWQLPLAPPRTLAGHTGDVRSLRITSDSQLVVTGDDTTVRAFALGSGQLARELPGHVGKVLSLAVSANNQLVASGSDRRRVKLWNLGDAADRLELFGHAGAVSAIAFHPDNARLATAGDDGTIRLWRLPAPPAALNGHTADVLALAVSADSQSALTGSTDKSVRLWNTANGQQIRQLDGHADAVRAVAYRTDGQQIATADAQGIVRLWNPADGAVQAILGAHGAGVASIAFRPDGAQLATAGDDGTLKLWTLPLVPAKSLAASAEAVSDIAIASDGKLVVTGGADKTVRVFDGAGGTELRQLGPPGGVVTSLATDAAASIAAAGSDDGVIRFWHTADGTPRTAPPAAQGQPAPAAPPVLALSQIAGHAGAVLDLAIDEKNQRIASAGADGTVRLWRMPTLPDVIATSATPIAKFIASADGKLIATAGTAEDRPAVIVRNAVTGALVCNLLGHTAAVTQLAFSKDGTRIASTGADKTARMWNLADAKFPEVASIVHAADITAVAVSDDNARLITAASDNVVRIWPAPLPEGGVAVEAKGHGGAIAALRASGAQVISASADGTVRVWNMADGAAVRTITHGAAVNDAAVSVDGKWIASAGADNSVKLWNAADGAAVATLAGHPTAVLQLVFSSDGARLASASAEGVWLWDVVGQRRLETLATGALKLQGVALADGKILTATAEGAVLRIAPHLVHMFDGHAGAVEAIALSPGGAQLATSGADKTVRLWEAATGKPLRTFSGAQDVVTSLAISADGARLVGGSIDKNVYSWPLAAAAAEIPAEFSLAATAPVRDVKLSADGQRLVAAGDGMLVHLWDLASRREVERFVGHTAAVSAVAITADGNMIASGSVDKTARIAPLGATQFIVADEEPLTDVAFAPHATQPKLSAWLTIGSDNAVKFWSVEGKPLRTLVLAEKSPVRLAVRPGGAELAVLLADGSVQIYTLADDQLARTLAAPAAPAAALDAAAPPQPPGDLHYSADGARLLVAAQQWLRVFDAADGRLLEAYAEPPGLTSAAFGAATSVVTTRLGAQGNLALRQLCLERLIVGPKGAVSALAFTPDGNRLASGGADDNVSLWTLADGKLARSYAGGAAPVTSLAITPDGLKLIAGGEDRLARVWNIAPPADADAAAPIAPLLSIEHAAAVRSVSASADNLKLATCAADGAVQVWDLATGKMLERFAAHAGGAHAVAFAADNRTVASAGAAGSAQISTLAIIRSVAAHAAKASDFALLQAGAQAATVGNEGSLKLWNTGDGSLIRETKAGEVSLVTVAARADNQQLAAADADGRLYLFSAAGEPITQFQTTSAIHDLRYSADNLKLVAACQESRLRFYNPLDGALLYELATPQPVRSAAFTTDSTRAVAADVAGGVQLWKYASPTAIRTLNGHGGRVYGVSFSPDGKQIASASADQTLRIWDTATGQQLKQLSGHTGAVYALAYSPDGALLLSSGADKTLRLWDVLGARQLKQIDTSNTDYALAFHNDSRRVAVAGVDRTIRLFDVISGAASARLEGHKDFVYRVKFNAGGTRLLSCGYGGVIQLWDLEGKPVFAADLDRVTYSADLSPDSSQIIVAGGDGEVSFIEVPASVR